MKAKARLLAYRRFTNRPVKLPFWIQEQMLQTGKHTISNYVNNSGERITVDRFSFEISFPVVI